MTQTAAGGIELLQTNWDAVPVIAYCHKGIAAQSSAARVVLLHGLAGNASQWFETFAVLTRQGYLSLAFDLPGHGQSGLPTDTPLTPRWMGQALGNWLMTHFSDPTVLVGHSLGGWVALWAYLTQPRAIAALVLVASTGLQGMPLGAPHIDVTTGLGQLTQQLLSQLFYHPQTIEPRILQAILAQAMTAPGLWALRPDGLLSDSDLAHVHCPVHLVWGEADQIIPTQWAQAFHQAIPHSELVLFPECGHFPHIEASQLFQQQLLQSLGQFSNTS